MTTTRERHTVLVTGATGRTGRHVVRGLLDRGIAVRALVRHPQSADLPDEMSIVEGSLEDTTAVAEAARGADAAFLLWPMAHPPQPVVTALANQVDHVVYLSAAGDLARPDGHGDGEPMRGVFAEVERALRRSGASWTFVRPGGFAANALAWADQIRCGDTLRIPYPDAGRSPIHERDIAQVAVAALLDPAMTGRAVTITGPATLTQREQVATIGAALGRELHVEAQPIEEARAAYAAIAGDDFADQALGYWAGLVDKPELVRDGVVRATGRPARPFAEWVRDHLDDFA
jgi:uncharacterized protein YbjT (DUF2867 family)